jgi:hypothetical protein
MTDPYRPNAGEPPADPSGTFQPAQPYPGPAPQPYPNPYASPDPQPYAAALPAPYAPEVYPYDFGYGSPYAYPGYQAPRPTDGFAIASLVVSCVAVLGLCAWGIGGLLGVLGAIFGHVSRRRIRQTGASGGGMALAGIIVGWSMVAISVVLLTLFIVLIVAAENSNPTY